MIQTPKKKKKNNIPLPGLKTGPLVYMISTFNHSATETAGIDIKNMQVGCCESQLSGIDLFLQLPVTGL